MAETMSRSTETSLNQSLFAAGRGDGEPFWFTLRKQPLAAVQAGRLKKARYWARSLSAKGSSKGSTIAIKPPMTRPLRSVRWYAAWRSAGVYPAGADPASAGEPAAAGPSTRSQVTPWGSADCAQAEAG